MRALVVYESMFGNTEAIANAIGEGLSTRVPADVVEVGKAPAEVGPDVALLVVGGPTHAFSMSRPQTRRDAVKQAGHQVVSSSGIREWLAAVTRSAAVRATAFDTRVKKGWVPGSAARAAQRRLAGKGFGPAGPPTTFYVSDTLGPLLEGEVTRARQWGAELAAAVATESAGPQAG
jgi:hypothetical protein